MFRKNDFPEGLPWLQPEIAVREVAPGGDGELLASFIGLPSGESWKHQVENSPNPSEEVRMGIDDIIGSGGFHQEEDTDALDYGKSVYIWNVGVENSHQVLKSLSTRLDTGTFSKIENTLQNLVAMPGVVTVASRPHTSRHVQGVFAFHRSVDIGADRITYTIEPLMVGSCDSVGEASLAAAYYNQVLSDLECVVNGLHQSGRQVTVECYVNISTNDFSENFVENLADCIDMAQDCLFGMDGDIAPEDMDWERLDMKRSVLVGVRSSHPVPTL